MWYKTSAIIEASQSGNQLKILYKKFNLILRKLGMIIVASKNTSLIMLPWTLYEHFSNSLSTQILKTNKNPSSA